MYREELTQIAETIWESVLQMQLVPVGVEAPLTDQRMLTASVNFVGGWEGELCAVLPESLGRSIAAAMLVSEPAELAQDDVLDAVGEIVNMLGGNVKALLPAPCQLSLPRVVVGHPTARPLVRQWIKEDLNFSCREQLLQIHLRAAPTVELSEVASR